MQRVDPAVLDGAAGGHQGLGGHLAPEDPLALLVGLDAPEDVHLDGLEVEQVDQEVEGLAHPAMLAGPGPRAKPRPAGTVPAMTARATPSRHDRASPTGSCGGRPRRPTRSRAGTSTTTGGPWSTTRTRAAPSPAATPATRSTGGPRTSTWWPTSGWGLPVLARVEPDRAGRGRVVAWPPWTTTGACAPLPGAGDPAGGDLPPLHHAPVAGRPRRLGGARRPRALRPLRASGRPPTWAT